MYMFNKSLSVAIALTLGAPATQAALTPRVF